MLQVLQELMGLPSMKTAPRSSDNRTKVIWITNVLLEAIILLSAEINCFLHICLSH